MFNLSALQQLLKIHRFNYIKRRLIYILMCMCKYMIRFLGSIGLLHILLFTTLEYGIVSPTQKIFLHLSENQFQDPANAA